MELVVAEFQQGAGLALEQFAERDERRGFDDLRGRVAHQFVAARDAQPDQVVEPVGRQAVLVELGLELPINGHGRKIGPILRLDNSKVAPYYLVTPSTRAATMTAPTTDALPRLNEKETAKAIRSLLRAAFRRTKFSVTVGRGSMVSSVRVEWTGGATREQVAESTDQFAAGNFDGMTDSYEWDQSRRVHVNGTIYRPGTQYIQLQRHGLPVTSAESQEYIDGED